MSNYNPKDLGADCDNCPFKGAIIVPPSIPANAKLMVVGEHPGPYEEKTGEPFTGPSGRKLDYVLRRVGLDRKDVQLNNAVLCKPKKKVTAGEFKKALDCCRPRLAKELKEQNIIYPNRVVITYGQKSTRTITGKFQIFTWMGGPLTPICEIDAIVIPTLHTAFLLRSPEYTPVVLIHTERADAIARNKLKPWRWPVVYNNHQHSNQEILEKLLELEKSEVLAVDIETNGLDYKSVIKDIALCNDKIVVSVQPWLVKDAKIIQTLKRIFRNRRIKKVLQNGQFDKFCLDYSGYFLSNVDFDTLLAHQVIAPRWRHDLGFQGAVEFHAPRWKAEFKAEGEELWNSDEKAIERAIYNGRDAYITYLLHIRYIARFKKREKEQFDELMEELALALKMRKAGIPVAIENLSTHDAALLIREDEALTKSKKFAASLGLEDFNPYSSRDLNTIFNVTLGIRPKAYSEKTGAPKYDATELVRLSSHENIVARQFSILILEYKKVKKLRSTYITNLVIDYDGCIRPTWRPGAAITRRWGCSNPNMMNIPKAKGES